MKVGLHGDNGNGDTRMMASSRIVPLCMTDRKLLYTGVVNYRILLDCKPGDKLLNNCILYGCKVGSRLLNDCVLHTCEVNAGSLIRCEVWSRSDLVSVFRETPSKRGCKPIWFLRFDPLKEGANRFENIFCKERKKWLEGIKPTDKS